MQQFVIALRDRGVRPVTCNTNIAALNAFCLWLHQEGHSKDRVRLAKLRCGWHRLRHTFATNYLRQGGDIVRLSMVLGHTQITTTQRYLHLLTEDLSVVTDD